MGPKAYQPYYILSESGGSFPFSGAKPSNPGASGVCETAELPYRRMGRDRDGSCDTRDGGWRNILVLQYYDEWCDEQLAPPTEAAQSFFATKDRACLCRQVIGRSDHRRA